MLQTLKILKNEEVVNIKELQKSPTRYLQGITRILRGKDTLGYFLDEKIFANLVEDLEAAGNPEFLKSIVRARKSKKHTPLSVLTKKYGV
jgi:hypothetical protein